MKMTYDAAADAAYLYTVDTVGVGEVARTEVCDVELDRASINLDFDAGGRLVGIEVLGASRVLRPESLSVRAVPTDLDLDASRQPSGLAWENTVVLMAAQALLGLVSPELRGVSVEVSGRSVTIHFAVAERYEEMDDDVNDVVAGTEGFLFPGEVEVRAEITLGSNALSWSGREHRMIFAAKGWT